MVSRSDEAGPSVQTILVRLSIGGVVPWWTCKATPDPAFVQTSIIQRIDHFGKMLSRVYLRYIFFIRRPSQTGLAVLQ